MAQEIMISQWEFWAAIFGWVMTVILGLLTVAFIKLTPAKVFLKAWLNKHPVGMLIDRTGMSSFEIGKTKDPGSMDVKGHGYFQMVEGSHVMDKQSKVPIFQCFSEYGVTIDKMYGPILDELRSAGFTINTFKDYQHLVRLATEADYADKILAKYEGEALEEAKRQIQILKNHDIQIKPFKSYKFHQLAAMFPNNISPLYVDAKCTNMVNRNLKKIKENMKIPLYVGMGALMIVLAIVIVWKTITHPAPEVIVNTVGPAIETVKTNMTV